MIFVLIYSAFTSRIKKLESLIAFTLQNKCKNYNQNLGDHPNLGMRNRRLIRKGVRERG